MRVNHEIKYQENNKLFLIFLKRKEIQRVPYCCFIAFSKWAKVEGYIDLGVIVPLLFKDSLKSQTLLFLYRSFAEPSTMFKFSQSKQIWGLQSIYWAFLRLHILEMLCKNWVPSIYQWKISSNMKFSYTNLWKSEKKLLWSKYWGLHCQRMLSNKSKINAVSLLCNITQIWQLLSVSMRNIFI